MIVKECGGRRGQLLSPISARIVWHITSIMIATTVGSLYATQKLRQDGLSHCSQPRAGRRVAEHPDYSGRPTRVHAVRPVSESLNIAPNTLPPVERAGSCGRF